MNSLIFYYTTFSFLCSLSLFRLPVQKLASDRELEGEIFINNLDMKRESTTSIKITEKKKLNIPPGKGITLDDLSHKHSQVINTFIP